MKKEVKWKVGDVYNLYSALDQVKVKSLILSAAVFKTLEGLRPYFEFIKPSSYIPMGEDYKAYEKAFGDLNRELSKGKTKFMGNQEVYDIDIESPAYKKKVEKLKEEHKEAIQAREDQFQKWKEFLDQDFEDEVILYKVDPEKVPDSAITEEKDFKIISFLLK